MRRQRVPFQLIGFLWAAGTLVGQESSASVPSGLAGALRFVLDQAPQLQSQEALSDLANGDRWRRFVPNEPQFQYTNSDSDTARAYGLSLTVPFPGKSFAFTKVDAARARGARAELEAKRYDLGRSTVQAYLDCSSAIEYFELQKSTSLDLETIANSLRALYEGGRSSQGEKIGAELQARQSQLDLVTALDKKDSLCEKYSRFLARAAGVAEEPVPSALPLPDDLEPSAVSYLGAGTSDRQRAVAALEAAEASSFTSWWSQLPDLTLSAQRNHYVYLPGSPAGKEWTTTYSVGITIPIFAPFHEAVEGVRGKRQATVDASTADLQLAASLADEDDGAKEYRREKARLVELRRKDLALAEAWLDSTYSAYRSGKAGFSDLVLARKTLTDLKNQDIQLRVALINAHLRCLENCENAPGVSHHD